ncbi:MAG TPA: S-layer homology domain-containing protein [Blastocatellia bacterium]|nr:S-layer homology domain-containing protein [Blastocatellia bacterium]
MSHATTVVMPTDDDMVIGARLIIRAKVVGIETAYDANRDAVFTYVTLRVREVIKGSLIDRRIVIEEMGGEWGDRITRVYGSPEFSLGERVFLYLDTSPDGTLRVHQMFLGKFTIVSDQTTGQDYVVRSTPDSGVSILPSAAGLRITSRMELVEYTQMVRGNLSANWDRAQAFETQYYSNVPVLIRPSDYNEALRSDGLVPQFTLLGNFRWFEPDSGQTVTYFVNPAGAPNTTFATDITAALNAWSTVSGCSLRLANGGSTTNCTNVGNTIVFNNCDGQFSPGGGTCSGVLARGGWSSTSGARRVVNGVDFGQITRGTVTFNPFMACFNSDSCRLREVATHELGHSVGLDHSSDQTATMAPMAHNDGRCASLRTDDINGIKFIYPGSASGPTINTTSPLTNALVNTAYSQTLAASGGTTPYTWNLATGSTLPGGLSLSAGGVISGTSPVTSANVYNFTVEVRDSASRLGTKAFSLTVNFSDVPPSHQFFTWVNAIARSGITAGCGGTSFCPGSTVTRAQMAIFIDRSMGINPATPTSQRFTDVPPNHFAYRFIDDLAQRGIMPGCTATTFCPDGLISRAEMAVIIEKALGVFNPPTPTSQRFLDVPPTHFAYAFINDFAARGITAGCGSGNYCPNSSVTRGEMSVFLVRAFGL